MQTRRKQFSIRRASKASRDRTLWCDTPSYLGAAEGICMLVRHFLQQIRMPYLVFSTELIVRECLNNAIHHGNNGDPDKRIKLRVTAARESIRVSVADQGRGFEWRKFVNRQPPSGSECTGRGLAVIGAYASHVAFNRKGNVITVEINDKP